MSLYELPENLIKAIVDEGMKTAWKESLSLPTEAARTRAKAIIRKRAMESRGLRAFPEDAQMAARMFLEVGPLLAEHEAISKAVKKTSDASQRGTRDSGQKRSEGAGGSGIPVRDKQSQGLSGNTSNENGAERKSSDEATERLKQQQQVKDDTPIKAADEANIAETLPLLYSEQHEDIKAIEKRLYSNGKSYEIGVYTIAFRGLFGHKQGGLREYMRMPKPLLME